MKNNACSVATGSSERFVRSFQGRVCKSMADGELCKNPPRTMHRWLVPNLAFVSQNIKVTIPHTENSLVEIGKTVSVADCHSIQWFSV